MDLGADVTVLSEQKLAQVASGKAPQKERKEREDGPRPVEDFGESIASMSDDEEVLENQQEQAEQEPAQQDDPGVPLLWEQRRLGAAHDRDRSSGPSPASQTSRAVPRPGDNDDATSATTSPSRNPISRIVSSASRVQFSPRVRISSGRSTGNTWSPGQVSMPAGPSSRAVSQVHSTASSVSLSSSISASLRTSSPAWLFLTSTKEAGTSASASASGARGGGDSGALSGESGTASEVEAPDYFSIRSKRSASGAKSPASSRRLSYDAEEERLAAEAARARADIITPGAIRRSASRDGTHARSTSYKSIRSEGKRTLRSKTETDVIFGPGRRRWLDWRWWAWKIRRALAALVVWWAGSDEDAEWGERQRLV